MICFCVTLHSSIRYLFNPFGGFGNVAEDHRGTRSLALCLDRQSNSPNLVFVHSTAFAKFPIHADHFDEAIYDLPWYGIGFGLSDVGLLWAHPAAGEVDGEANSSSMESYSRADGSTPTEHELTVCILFSYPTQKRSHNEIRIKSK